MTLDSDLGLFVEQRDLRKEQSLHSLALKNGGPSAFTGELQESIARKAHHMLPKPTLATNVKHASTHSSLSARRYDARQVQEGDSTEGSPMGLTVPSDENASVILPATALLSYVASPQVLQKSSRPSLAANLTLAGVPGGEDGGAGFGADGGSITIDTALPEVDTEKGMEVSGDGNGTYAYGDAVYITVW